MDTMKALRFDRFGSPEVLALDEIARPEPGAGEVLVEIHATAINPSDVKNVAGAFHATLPRTPGRDFAGVVAAGRTWVGREVWGVGAGFGVGRDGAHAEYAVLPAAWLSEKPKRLSMAEAASCGLPFLTAFAALVDRAELLAGETVLVTGALGAVGQAALQIARWRGATAIAADRREPPAGLTPYLRIDGPDFAGAVRSATGGRGADLVLDCVGGALFETCLNALAPNGRQVAITSAGNRRVTFDLLDFYHNQSRLIGLDTFKLTGTAIAAALDALRIGFDAGALNPAAIRTWPLADAPAAYAATADGASRAKNVLLPR